jgi:hypothetical protein
MSLVLVLVSTLIDEINREAFIIKTENHVSLHQILFLAGQVNRKGLEGKNYE